MSFDESIIEIHPETPAEWRAWLDANHHSAAGVWLIYFRASTGRRRLSWEQAVQEALCFGWIDSKVQPIDDERYRQVFTPRKPRSVWSKVNKQYVEELTAAGRMTEAGQRAIDVGKANGAWSVLDPIDDLIVPDELAAAFDAAPRARAAYERRSDTAKRSVLFPIHMAKRPDTRARRIAASIAELESEADDV